MRISAFTRTIGLAAFAFSMMFYSFRADAVNMKEGDWGFTYRIEVTGAPFPLPPITFRRTMCLTKENLVPDASKKGENCEYRNKKVKGDTVSWTMVCKDRDMITKGKGRMTYKGDSADGEINMEATDSRGRAMQTMHYTITGQRFGKCD